LEEKTPRTPTNAKSLGQDPPNALGMDWNAKSVRFIGGFGVGKSGEP
jgi:hypothetical protein